MDVQEREFMVKVPQRIPYPPHLKWMLNRALEDLEGFWGEVACSFGVLKRQHTTSYQIRKEPKQVVRENLELDDIFFVDKIPKTRSGKIMRRLIKALIIDQPLGDISTIEDKTSIEDVKKALGKP